MRTSNYIHYVSLPAKDIYYTVHGYTGAIDKITPEVLRYLLEHRDSRPSTHTKDEKIALESLGERGFGPVNPETLETLASRGYLTDKSVEEERDYVVRLTHRFHDLAVKRQRPGFLIMPTYECNLRCPYCFETETRIDLNKEGLLKTVMSREMADAAFRTMDVLLERTLPDNMPLEKARQGMSITLYGGEPLQQPTFPIVEYIVRKGRELGMNFRAITNGVELHEFKNLLGPEGVRWMQITFDGPKDIHELSRLGPRYRHTYDPIMDNMELAIQQGASISVRLHADWESIDRTPEILQELERRGLLQHERFSIYATPRHAWHVGEEFPIYPNIAQYQLRQKVAGLASTPSVAGKQMKKVSVMDDRVTEKLRTYMRGGIAALSQTIEFCSANTGGMHILDPFGAIYSCWDTVGIESERVGTYSMDGPVFGPRSDDWKNRCPGDIPQCSNCKYVMFHFGGCSGLPVEMGYGLLHPACYAFQDMFILQSRKFLGEEKFKELSEPPPPADTPMDLDASAVAD